MLVEGNAGSGKAPVLLDRDLPFDLYRIELSEASALPRPACGRAWGIPSTGTVESIRRAITPILIRRKLRSFFVTGIGGLHVPWHQYLGLTDGEICGVRQTAGTTFACPAARDWNDRSIATGSRNQPFKQGSVGISDAHRGNGSCSPRVIGS